MLWTGFAVTFFSFIFISWRLITLHYCSGFIHMCVKLLIINLCLSMSYLTSQCLSPALLIFLPSLSIKFLCTLFGNDIWYSWIYNACWIQFIFFLFSLKPTLIKLSLHHSTEIALIKVVRVLYVAKFSGQFSIFIFLIYQ